MNAPRNGRRSNADLPQDVDGLSRRLDEHHTRLVSALDGLWSVVDLSNVRRSAGHDVHTLTSSVTGRSGSDGSSSSRRAGAMQAVKDRAGAVKHKAGAVKEKADAVKGRAGSVVGQASVVKEKAGAAGSQAQGLVMKDDGSVRTVPLAVIGAFLALAAVGAAIASRR